MNMLPPGQTMQDALASANLILSRLKEWEAEAAQESQLDQDDRTGEAVMREHIAYVIRGSLNGIRAGCPTLTIADLEKLLGES